MNDAMRARLRASLFSPTSAFEQPQEGAQSPTEPPEPRQPPTLVHKMIGVLEDARDLLLYDDLNAESAEEACAAVEEVLDLLRSDA